MASPARWRRTLVLDLFLLLRSLKAIISFRLKLYRRFSGSERLSFSLRHCLFIVEAELEFFCILEIVILNICGEPIPGKRVKNHLNAAHLVRECRTWDLDVKLWLLVVALECETGAELLQLFGGADFVLSLTVDVNGLEYLVRAAHVVDAAEGDGLVLILDVELQFGVALEPELRNLEAQLLHQESHDVVDLSIDVQGAVSHWRLLQVDDDHVLATLDGGLGHGSSRMNAKTRTEAKHKVGTGAVLKADSHIFVAQRLVEVYDRVKKPSLAVLVVA